MKTYPHQEHDDIIELVRKDEHDAVVAELNERLTKQQADMLDTIVQLRLELTHWQSLAERLSNDINPLAEAVKRMEEVTDGAIVAAYWETGSWISNVRTRLISAAKGEQP